MRPLSARLKAIFDLVPDKAKVADIGTDHAYLPIALSLENKCESIIACDINEKPLSSARKNINKFGIKNIDVRLGNGLSPVNKGEADTIIIAGMGGDVISHILAECDWVKNKNITLLLQPMTSAEILRTFLIENCFEILSETAIIEQGKIYTVIEVHYCGIKKSYPAGFEYTGLISSDYPEGKAYILKQLKRIDCCIKDLLKVPDKSETIAQLKKVKTYIESLLEIK